MAVYSAVILVGIEDIFTGSQTSQPTDSSIVGEGRGDRIPYTRLRINCGIISSRCLIIENWSILGISIGPVNCDHCHCLGDPGTQPASSLGRPKICCCCAVQNHAIFSIRPVIEGVN
ncbi:hypothetical protein J6590_040037 [Homalodisca vitripennis]|nr:hypothetical protein J6590_040037 [Homalodisca vitripennis]